MIEAMIFQVSPPRSPRTVRVEAIGGGCTRVTVDALYDRFGTVRVYAFDFAANDPALAVVLALLNRPPADPFIA